jgi:hypothetical protein
MRSSIWQVAAEKRHSHPAWSCRIVNWCWLFQGGVKPTEDGGGSAVGGGAAALAPPASYLGQSRPPDLFNHIILSPQLSERILE